MANSKKSQKNRKKTFSNAIIILLAVVILWLLLYILFWNPIVKKTAHVHVFELSYCSACASNVPETGEYDDGTTKIEPSLTVFDSEATWGVNTEADIFRDSLYENRELIAPHSTNTYKFIVRNQTTIPIQYNLSFEEENADLINMKYRLIRDGAYIAGGEDEWVTYDQLTATDISINNNIDHTYYLDWQWFDSANDTDLGENATANYKIKINIKAKQKTNAN